MDVGYLLSSIDKGLSIIISDGKSNYNVIGTVIHGVSKSRMIVYQSDEGITYVDDVNYVCDNFKLVF